jgi:hypothetical protein
MGQANDLDEVLISEQAADCYFLEQYDSYYADHKKMPLAIEVPMVCVINNGHTMIDYSKATFGSLNDFGTDVISLDDDAAYLASLNFDRTDYAPMSDFMDNDSNNSAVMVSSTMRINDIRSHLTSYNKSFIYPDMNEVRCNFMYEWSISSKNRNNTAAAERLLSWMLGNVYQSTLMINTAGKGEIPINKEAYTEKISSVYYAGITGDAYKKFVFKNDKNDEEGETD